MELFFELLLKFGPSGFGGFEFLGDFGHFLVEFEG
jgi:hypothetical protein